MLRSPGAVGSAARGASTPTEGGEGRGHIVAAACLQIVIITIAELGELCTVFCSFGQSVKLVTELVLQLLALL